MRNPHPLASLAMRTRVSLLSMDEENYRRCVELNVYWYLQNKPERSKHADPQHADPQQLIMFSRALSNYSYRPE